MCVSILVLMDLPFLQELWMILWTFLTKFQSLFLWIFRSYEYFVHCIGYNSFGFQSLFLWIFRYYSDLYRKNHKMASEVSILVLMDLPFLHYVRLNIYRVMDILFQSLFLWIFRSYKLIGCYSNLNDASFNPCSYGSSVLTKEVSKIWYRWKESFNPCSYGSSVLTFKINEYYEDMILGFNPCSYGSSVLTNKNSYNHIIF